MNVLSFLSYGLGISDNFSNSSSEEGELSEAELQAADATAARKVYRKKLKHWCDYKVDWVSVFPDVEFPDEPQPINYFLPLDVGLVYYKMIRYNKKRKMFGFLPLMASCSKGYIGELDAESYL